MTRPANTTKPDNQRLANRVVGGVALACAVLWSVRAYGQAQPAEEPPPLGAEQPPATAPPATDDEPVEVSPPAESMPAPTEGEPAATGDDSKGGEVIEVTGKKVAPPPRTTSDFHVDRALIATAPHQDTGAILSVAPGIYVAREGGDALAQEYVLRGFDAEHGQDIEFKAAGIPINQRWHIHGQGYADLGYIPPEVVRSVRVLEGVYDPRQGDFATAGTIELDLGVEERGHRAQTSFGSFGEQRNLLLWAPEGESPETFGVVTFKKTDGFGENRGSRSASGLASYGFRAGDRTHGVLHAAAHGARSNLAGVLRQDDLDAGLVGFYDAYPDPTAQSQSVLASRAEVGLQLRRDADDGSDVGFGTWVLFNDYRGRQNNTGYAERSEMKPEEAGRGDLIEQANQSWSLGIDFDGRTRLYKPYPWASGVVSAGLDTRLDLTDQQQNLLEAPQNETWDKRVDASIQGASLGGWLDADWWLTDRLRLRGGYRADALYFDIDDRFGNFVPTFERQEQFIGFRRTALGFASGPRATAEYVPVKWGAAVAAYGEGYRSPQARQLEEGETAPFAKVKSAEIGVRLNPPDSDAWKLTAAVYRTRLSLDLALDPQENSLERIGPTTRLGTVLHLDARPLPGLIAAASFTTVRATLDSPPPATAENPSPPFTEGALLPFVPPVVMRIDVGYRRRWLEWAGAPVIGQVGAGFQYLSPRPLPFSESGDPVYLLDALAQVKWRNFDLGVSGFNLLDRRYAGLEFNYVSNWHQDQVPSRIPGRHIIAGPPLTFLVTLGATL